MKTPRKYLLLSAVVLASLGSGFAYATDNDDAMEDQAEYQQLQKAKITVIEAIQKAQETHPGMIVAGVDFEEEAESPAFSVELLSEAGETEVTVSAITGEIIPEND